MSMMVGARSTRSCEINVTPLIDVLLVLLIIFMVILPEHKMGEKTLIPQPSPENPAQTPRSADRHPIQRRGESKRPILKINQEEIPGTAWKPGSRPFISSGRTGWRL